MSGAGEPTPTPTPESTLIREIERYLETIAVFRALGHEPTWRVERDAGVVARVRAWLEPCEPAVSGP